MSLTSMCRLSLSKKMLPGGATGAFLDVVGFFVIEEPSTRGAEIF